MLGAMHSLTLPEAARQSGRSARELRLIIEAGELPAAQQGGRWMVAAVDLEQLVLPEPRHPEPSPSTRGLRLTEVPPPTDFVPGAPPLDDVLARLEARAMEVASLRTELEDARARIAELERGADRPAGRRPGMRDALNPLFEQSRAPAEPEAG